MDCQNSWSPTMDTVYTKRVCTIRSSKWNQAHQECTIPPCLKWSSRAIYYETLFTGRRKRWPIPTSQSRRVPVHIPDYGPCYYQRHSQRTISRSQLRTRVDFLRKHPKEEVRTKQAEQKQLFDPLTKDRFLSRMPCNGPEITVGKRNGFQVQY